MTTTNEVSNAEKLAALVRDLIDHAFNDGQKGLESPSYETLAAESEVLAALAATPAAPQPEERVPLTWEQFVAACEAEYGEDFEPQPIAQATEEEKAQMLRVVRMIERAHGIGKGKESA